MSENNQFGFAKLVPGFDFLQNLTKGASQNMAQMPSLSSWVAPTLNVEELDKRITELKAVHFWLDQNGKALSATIQALEVQKMTLATLQGMNFSMGEVADALKLKPAAAAGGAQKEKAREPAGDAAATNESARASGAKTKAGGTGTGAGAAVDPLQWWGALTQQFQEIATNAMKDVGQKGGAESAGRAAMDAAQEAMKAGADMMKNAGKLPSSAAKSAPAPATSKKTARKPAPRKRNAGST